MTIDYILNEDKEYENIYSQKILNFELKLEQNIVKYLE